MTQDNRTSSRKDGAVFQADGCECCAECGGPISGGGAETTFGGTRCWPCEDAINGVGGDDE